MPFSKDETMFTAHNYKQRIARFPFIDIDVILRGTGSPLDKTFRTKSCLSNVKKRVTYSGQNSVVKKINTFVCCSKSRKSRDQVLDRYFD